MKFLFVCSGLGGGGAERVAVNLANGLVGMGNEVSIFTRPVEESYSTGDKVGVIVAVSSGFWGRFFSLFREIKNNNYDAIVSFTDSPNIDAFFAWRLSGSKAVYIPTIHSDICARDSRLRHDLRFFLLRFLHKKACSNADKVVVVSKAGGESFSRYYSINPESVAPLYNPVLADGEFFSAGRKPVGHKRKVRLIAAGRLSMAKNYYLMVDAVARLNEGQDRVYVLDIYGEGELRPDLESYVEKKNMGGHVIFKGFAEDLASIMRDYDLFVFGSDWEGFGNVLVEALNAGLPVVSTDCPSGPREILGEGRYGRLVKTGDVDGFAKAVVEEVERPLMVDSEDLKKHLLQFREGVVSEKYFEVISNVRRNKTQN